MTRCSHPVSSWACAYDDGDAETGLGLELGAGLRYADSVRGLTVEDEGAGIAGPRRRCLSGVGVERQPVPGPGAPGRGLALRLDSGWGVADSGAEALWQRQTTGRHRPAA